MKRLRLIPVLGLCLCLAGCGNGAFAPKTEGAAAGALESATTQSSAASEQASEADSKDNETADSGNTAEEEELSQYEIWREYIQKSRWMKSRKSFIRDLLMERWRQNTRKTAANFAIILIYPLIKRVTHYLRLKA